MTLKPKTSVLLILFFVICIVIYLNFNKQMNSNLFKVEKYIDLDKIDSYDISYRDSDFYLSPIRVRDYQDIISITESQLIETV
jgi:hypothetical protein